MRKNNLACLLFILGVIFPQLIEAKTYENWNVASATVQYEFVTPATITTNYEGNISVSVVKNDPASDLSIGIWDATIGSSGNYVASSADETIIYYAQANKAYDIRVILDNTTPTTFYIEVEYPYDEINPTANINVNGNQVLYSNASTYNINWVAGDADSGISNIYIDVDSENGSYNQKLCIEKVSDVSYNIVR